MPFRVGDRVFVVRGQFAVRSESGEYGTVENATPVSSPSILDGLPIYWVRFSRDTMRAFLRENLADAKTSEPCKEPPGYRPRDLTPRYGPEYVERVRQEVARRLGLSETR